MFRSRLTLLLVLASLAGCGQSGPLYLPGNPSQITTTPPGQPAPAATTTRETDENRDSDDE